MNHEAIHPSFHELIDEHAPVEQLGTGFIFTEGPIWHPVEHHLLFSDMPGDVRRLWDSSGVHEVQRPSNKGNGMTYDAALNLIVCEHSTSSLVRFRPDGTREVLCSHFEGKELNSPNDVIVRNDGSIYFTDPTYGRMEHFGVPRETELGFQGVYRLPTDHRPGDEPQLVSDRYMFNQPNGLCFSPCQRWMWVNDTDQANIRMFDVANDGRLTNGRLFASGISDPNKAGLPDGMKADAKGNVWVTAPGGVWVYDFHGRLIGKLNVPEMAANLHWGGNNWDTLFICASTSLYAVKTKVLPRREPFMAAALNAPAEHEDAAPIASPSSGVGGAPVSASQATDVASADDASLQLDGNRTVLIIQDLQNDVMMDGGAFADTGSPDHAREQNVVANVKRLAEACRAAGVLIIHVWMVAEPGHPAMRRNSPLMEGLVDSNALVRGTWGVQPVSGLEPQTGDLVVEKLSMSAWESGRLENYVKGAFRDTIISTGSWTNMSVEHTARTGADKGYTVIVPEDACSTMNAEWHRASIEFGLTSVSTVTNVDAVIAALR
ncbi:isochorismatase family protein [Ahrensia sp. R2A130]|uniref:isochorismatase family protein n=1 Tax=Ahrensia sp. R2A130 TaxID=744979 RepID=UPI0001E0C380|nr:isochorismatase family protein [Ahrensia sp. R2A130]EFL87819.1 gluconolactonase [Ahrensia sp. R2A130]